MTILVRIVVLCLLAFAGNAWASQALAPQIMADAQSITAVTPSNQTPDALPEPSNADTNAIQKTNNVSNVLQLTLPTPTTTVPARATHGNAALLSAHNTNNTFNLKPNPIVHPATVPIDLFPSEYGMRGFMSEKWLSRYFGFTAGLGIKLNQNEPSTQYVDNLNLNMLSEQLLFGLGLLVAF